MAGEQGGGEGITYNDIDANKMVNKAGLLELSGKIKGYIQANAGGGASYTAGDGIDITNDVISSTVKAPRIISVDGIVLSSLGLTQDDKDYLVNLFNYGPGEYPCIINWNRTNFGITNSYFNYLGKQDTKLYFLGVSSKNPGDNSMLRILSFTIKNNAVTAFANPSDSIASAAVGATGIQIGSYSSPTGTNTSLSNAMKYIKDNYATKAELPSIPTDPSTDGTYILTNTVSSGTATQTWESVVIGGSY